MLLLLAVSYSNVASAEVKVYQYDGKLPFVQMMLNMMVAMGIIDRLPTSSVYGGYPGSSFSSPWSSMSNPYARVLAMRGLTSGGGMPWLTNPYMKNLYGGNPLLRSPWLDSPWSPAALSGSAWDAPDWTARPMDTYNYYDYMGLSPAWSSEDLTGWVDEPWETSSWNPDAREDKSRRSEQQNADDGGSRTGNNTMPPLVQNFNYSVSPEIRQQDGRSPQLQSQQSRSQQSGSQEGRPPQSSQKRGRQSPLAKLAPRGQQGYQQGYGPDPRSGQQGGQWQAQRPPQSSQQQAPQHKRKPKTPPCVTPFCGLKKPNLNGLWVAQNGEMLGIKNQRYLWSDGDARYLTGQMKIQNEYLLANVDGHDKLMRFKYKLAKGHLLTLQPDGTMREFIRMPGNQVRQY